MSVAVIALCISAVAVVGSIAGPLIVNKKAHDRATTTAFAREQRETRGLAYAPILDWARELESWAEARRFPSGMPARPPAGPYPVPPTASLDWSREVATLVRRVERSADMMMGFGRIMDHIYSQPPSETIDGVREHLLDEYVNIHELLEPLRARLQEERWAQA